MACVADKPQVQGSPAKGVILMTDRTSTTPQGDMNVTAAEQQKTLNRVAVSSFMGNFIEWFDYASLFLFCHGYRVGILPGG